MHKYILSIVLSALFFSNYAQAQWTAKNIKKEFDWCKGAVQSADFQKLFQSEPESIESQKQAVDNVRLVQMLDLLGSQRCSCAYRSIVKDISYEKYLDGMEITDYLYSKKCIEVIQKTIPWNKD
jgi:hypothetical protein